MIISSRKIYWFILTLLAVGGSVLIWNVTHQGIGLGSDSAVYISAGKNLVAGRGLTWITGGGEMHPVTHFPPLFPLVLSGFEFIGVDPIAGARLLNSFLFGVNILLFAGILILTTGSQWFSVFGAFLISISIFMIRAHSWVMTEPLYLLLGFGGLIILASSIKNRQRTWLVLAGIALGLAYLTRYAGISLVVVGIIGLICPFGETWRRRLADAIIFMSVSLTPNLLWMLRNEFLTGYSTSRSLRLYFPTEEELFTVAKVFLGWFFPAELLDRLPDGFLLLGFYGVVLIIGLVVVSWIWNLLPNKNSMTLKPFQPWMGSLLAFHVVAFLGMMALSSILTYPPPALDFRLFLPLYLTVIVMIVWGLSVAWNSRNQILRSGVVLVIGLFTVSATIRSQAVISELLQNGQGYSGSQWQTSMTIASLQSLPSGSLYSNRPGAIYLLADRHSYTIPYFIPGREHEYDDELENMKNKMKHEGALLILFEEDRHPPESFRMEELTRDLVLLAEYSDGAIYAFPTGD